MFIILGVGKNSYISQIFIIVKDLIRKILKENEPSVHGEWVLPLAVYDFKKEVTKKEWQIISENLQVLYPGIVWKSRKPISNFPSKKMIQIAIYPGTWGDYLECIYTTKHIGLFEPHDKEQAKLIFDGSVLMNKHNTEEIFTKLNESVTSKYKLWSVKPGSFIYIREVNPQLQECDYNAYRTLKDLKGTICEVTGTAEDVNLMEMGEVEGETWCDDYWGWGMLIKSDKITIGHDGFGEDNGRCGRDDCYWVNHYFVDFDLIDPSFDTENAFIELYEQEELKWAEDLYNSFLYKQTQPRLNIFDLIGYTIKSKDGIWVHKITDIRDVGHVNHNVVKYQYDDNQESGWGEKYFLDMMWSGDYYLYDELGNEVEPESLVLSGEDPNHTHDLRGIKEGILKESEGEFDWTRDLVKKIENATLLPKNQKYVVKLCNQLKGDDIKWKFEELYGVNSLDKETRTINIFNNGYIDDQISEGNGIIIYVNPKGWDGLEMGWDLCSQANFKFITEMGYQIYDYNQFLNLIIEK